MNYRRYFIQNSMVFITIVTYNRKQILLDNIDLLKNSIKYTKTKINFKIVAIVVLKDHIHMVIQPEDINQYPNIVKYFKTYFSRHINVNISDLPKGKIYKKEKGVWQSRYWAHVILDENDLQRHIDYIHYNPMKHLNIKPKDWKYSTFKNFIELGYYDDSWCNFEDKNKILELNLE